MNLNEALRRLTGGESLSYDESYAMMTSLMGGEAPDALIAGLLIALRMKGETFDEIGGCAAAMQDRAAGRKIDRRPLIDPVGTGGHAVKLFNVSTVTAFVVAGAGGAVAKHGNRSNTSRCGAADCLEALGARLDLSPDRVAACVERHGVGFLFAPAFHPAMKHVAGARKALGVRTIFNILGPLTNPFRAECQVIGVHSEGLVETIALALTRMGRERSLVVHGVGGVCELSTIGPTRVAVIADGAVRMETWTPSDFGLKEAAAEDLAGGTPEDNAAIARSALIGEKGPRRDIVTLNAGAALHVAGLAGSVREGIERAKESIDSGEAMKKLEALIEFSQAAG